ncbi:MAG TPA: ThiF family adenylyltransferase [Gemmatimonadaceae bacterium]|jgi:molybdopterin/thiamine biosynthesis adenylyltransferase
MRFEVFAPLDLGYSRHQHPFVGNLCLLDQSTAAWHVSDTAVEILRTQLPLIDEANRSAEPRPDVEVPQPEPVSFYFSTLDSSVVIVPVEAYDSSRRPKSMRLAIARQEREVRGYVTALDSRPVALPDLRPATRPDTELIARCAHIEGAPPGGTAASLVPWLLDRRLVTEPRLSTGAISMDAISFDEDVAYGRQPERGWTFLLWRGVGGGLEANLVHAERYDSDEQGLRIPTARGLRRKTVALFGLGGIGAPIAHLLMQCRVSELRVVDHDTVSLGNAVRWPLGFALAGRLKTDAIRDFGAANYPESKVIAFNWRIGASALGGHRDELELLDAVLSGTDVLVDATAEPGIQLLLANVARERGFLLVTAEGREGGYGGLVARYWPDHLGCYHCLKLHQRDGRFVLPRDSATGMTQPRGCSAPTFTGAPFDLLPIAARAAGVVADAVCDQAETSNELSLFFARDDDSGIAAASPRWERHALVAHPECPTCRQ